MFVRRINPGFIAIFVTLFLLSCHSKHVADCSDFATIALVQDIASKHLSLKEMIVNRHNIQINNITRIGKHNKRFSCSAELKINGSAVFPITYTSKLLNKRGELLVEMHGLP